ncbi:MAG: DUF2095 family protein [Candidatus Thorarchaeota archaeon]
MNKKQKKEKIRLDSSDITEIDGLNINYDKRELLTKFPNLISEIDNKQKFLKIEAVDSKLEKGIKPSNDFKYCEDLSNLGAIDFIRRCKTNKEAINVLDYLLARKEISEQDHIFIVTKIHQKDGLKKLIEECGGYKTPGYYLKKYYNNVKIINDENTNND